MIKVFTLNKNNKIEFTKDELQKLLDEAYWDGYRNNHYWTWTSPSWTVNGPSSITTCSNEVPRTFTTSTNTEGIVYKSPSEN